MLSLKINKLMQEFFCLYHWIFVILSVKSFPMQANNSNINSLVELILQNIYNEKVAHIADI